MLKIISEIINTFKNHKLESISIIAPYLSEKFFVQLKKTYFNFQSYFNRNRCELS